MYTQEQIEDLLINVLGVKNIKQWKGNKIQFCCPVHGEKHPSCGINIDYSPNIGEHYTTFHCFSCGESGSMSWLLYKSLPDRFATLWKAMEFLENRYGTKEVNFKLDKNNKILLYEDFSDVKKRFEGDKMQLALFRSGKETYKYFYNRGFDSEDVKKFMIGRDVDKKTITIPCFYEDGALAGVIGRYISSKRTKNERYVIYDFPKSSVLFPMNLVKVHKDTIILVEGMLDCIMLYKWGINNACALMTNNISKAQVDIVKNLGCKKVIMLLDNDDMGKKGIDTARKNFKREGIMVLVPTYYPLNGKDPCEWGEKETLKVLRSANLLGKKINLL